LLSAGASTISNQSRSALSRAEGLRYYNNIFNMINKIKLLTLVFSISCLAGLLSACSIGADNVNGDFGKIASSSNQTNSDIIFYYSNTCTHCKVVEEFVVSNKISEKVSFQSKEVGADSANAADIMDKASKCGIKQEDIGVPMLWDGAKCYVGQDDVINFFKLKANVN
jgi:hypothetical protein